MADQRSIAGRLAGVACSGGRAHRAVGRREWRSHIIERVLSWRQLIGVISVVVAEVGSHLRATVHPQRFPGDDMREQNNVEPYWKRRGWFLSLIHISEP